MKTINLVNGYAKAMKIVTASDKATIKEMGMNYNPHFVDCYHMLVILPEHMLNEEPDVIRNKLSRCFHVPARCWHDYDCCGCRSTTAYQYQMQRINRKLWLVAVTVNANY